MLAQAKGVDAKFKMRNSHRQSSSLIQYLTFRSVSQPHALLDMVDAFGGMGTWTPLLQLFFNLFCHVASARRFAGITDRTSSF